MSRSVSISYLKLRCYSGLLTYSLSRCLRQGLTPVEDLRLQSLCRDFQQGGQEASSPHTPPPPFFLSLNPLTDSSPILYFCAFLHPSQKSSPLPPSLPPPRGLEMGHDGQICQSRGICHQIGTPTMPELSDKSCWAQPSLIYIQLHMHMSVMCTHLLRCEMCMCTSKHRLVCGTVCTHKQEISISSAHTQKVPECVNASG